MNYFIMILIGLKYLHGNEIMHRDLHPTNILVDKISPGFEILIISGFGLSKYSKEMKTHRNSLEDRTAPLYKAPEVYNG
jgi:serine/threonine protein kinase